MSLLMEALKKAEEAKEKELEQNEVSTHSAEPDHESIEFTVQEESGYDVDAGLTQDTPESSSTVEDFDEEIDLQLDEVDSAPESPTQWESEPPAPELTLEAQERAGQQQASRIFAVNSGRAPSGGMRRWLPASSVVILLLIGVGVYLYFDSTISGLSESVVEVPPEPVAEILGEEEPATEASGVRPIHREETQAEAAASPIEQVISASTGQAKRSAAAIARVTVASEAVEEESAIHITRSQKVDPVDALLSRAYQAYKAGDDELALKEYQAVLRIYGTNRDAMLGLAVIAHRNGNRELAGSYYASLLKLNPRDSLALSGLVSLQDGSSPVENESPIKSLLDQEPEAAHLHFTLGTLYASQSRWADAQQSFFSAHRYDPKNGDYAYNLAVSLDRIGQQASAAVYYQIALNLADDDQVIFDRSEVNKRLAILRSLKSSTQ